MMIKDNHSIDQNDDEIGRVLLIDLEKIKCNAPYFCFDEDNLFSNFDQLQKVRLKWAR